MGVVSNQSEVVSAEAGQKGGLLDRAVGLAGDVNDQGLFLGLQAALVQTEAGGLLPAHGRGHQGTGGSSVLNHSLPRRGQPHHLSDPVGGQLFQLGQGRTGLPGEAKHAQAGAEIIAQDTGQRAVGGKVAKKARMLPVRQSGQDDPIQVLEDRGEVLGLFGRRSRKLGLDLARLGASHHGFLNHVSTVISNPVDELMSDPAEFFGSHESLGNQRKVPPSGHFSVLYCRRWIFSSLRQVTNVPPQRMSPGFEPSLRSKKSRYLLRGRPNIA